MSNEATVKKKTGFALLTKEQRAENGRQAYAKAKAMGRTGHRWTSEESKALGNKGATACREQGKRHLFTAEDTAKSGGRFTSETGRLASEKKHDLAAMRNPEVEWTS